MEPEIDCLSARSESELEFPEIRRKLEEFCQTPAGRGLVAELKPSAQAGKVQRALEETGEIRAELEQGEFLPQLAAIAEITPILSRVRKDAVLEPEELLRVGGVLEGAETVQRFLKARPGRLSRVREHFGRVAGIPRLQQKLREAIDPSGRIRDEASPDLARLRKKRDFLENEIKERLQELIASPEWEDILQEKYYTLRLGRYVLPVKAERRAELKGIVHDFSSSGATVFIEPEFVVELNNHLRVAEGEVRREEGRILKNLSLLVQEQAAEIEEIYLRLGEFDLLLAKGKFSRLLGGGEVTLGEFPGFELRGGKHPLLILHKPQVVPNDLSLEGEHRGMVISGPNTGGKTVTMKMVGLSAALFQSGIIPALSDGSRLPVFRRILAVIGEEQSLERGLSAFSAYVVRVREVWEEVVPGSLVLLDDLFVGTDPHEGALLGRAVLQALVERGAVVLATTHLPELKLLPLEDARFEAAAVAFDLKTMSPTYRVERGFPGRSYGLEIARRLGIKEEIVAAAVSGVTDSHNTIEEILSRLHELENRRREQKVELDAERERQDLMRERLEEELQQVAQKKSRAREELKREGQALLSRIDREAAQIMLKLRETKTRQQAEPVRQELRKVKEKLERELDLGGEAEEKRPPAVMKAGASVWVKTLRKPGTIISLDPESAMVQVGVLKARVDRRDLAGVSGAEAAAKPARKASSASGVDSSADVRTEENTLDIRGETVEDGIARLEAFLDQAYLRDLGFVFIIHGSGTGRLREGIRKYLKGSAYVQSSRPGEDKEGGQGVTVVKLK